MSAATTTSSTQPDPITSAQAAAINPDPTPDDLKRRQAISRAWQAYRGEFPTIFKTPHGERSSEVRANRCAPIIDKSVAWLFGKDLSLGVRMADEDNVADTNGVTPPETPEQPAGDTDALQAALKKVWGGPDDMLTLLTMAAMNGGVSGHVFVKIIWDSTRMKYPRFSVLDSQNVYVLSDPDDCNRAVCYVIEYRTALGATGYGPNAAQRSITKRQVIALVDVDGNARYGAGGEDEDDYWTITNYVRYEQSGGPLGNMATSGAAAQSGQQNPWRQQGASLDWRYDFPPIIDCMNLPNPNEFWGISDLPPALIDLNEQLQFVESNIAKIIKSNAHPWIFATGCDPSSLHNEPGTVQALPAAESKVFALTATGDLAASMAFAETLRADMDEQSRVPAVALGRQESLPKGNLSGVALELLFQPLTEKIDLKRRLYGHLIRKASAYALELLGLIEDCDDVEIDINWSTLLPVDDLAAAQTAQALLQVGVSPQKVLEDLGYDYDEEMDKTNQDAQLRTQRQMRGQTMAATPTDLAARQAAREQQAKIMAMTGKPTASPQPGQMGQPAQMQQPMMQQGQ